MDPWEQLVYTCTKPAVVTFSFEYPFYLLYLLNFTGREGEWGKDSFYGK